jgi:hypothetical protein
LLSEYPKEWRSLQDLRLDGRLWLKCILKNKMRGVHRIDVAQDRSQWLAVFFVLRLIFLAEYPLTWPGLFSSEGVVYWI